MRDNRCVEWLISIWCPVANAFECIRNMNVHCHLRVQMRTRHTPLMRLCICGGRWTCILTHAKANGNVTHWQFVLQRFCFRCWLLICVYQSLYSEIFLFSKNFNGQNTCDGWNWFGGQSNRRCASNNGTTWWWRMVFRWIERGGSHVSKN